MAQLIAGVDGGQSSTSAAIAEAGGTIVGRGTGPPADLVGEPRGSTRQRDAIATALAAARADAKLPAEMPLAVAVIGLTGHDDGAPTPPALRTLAERVRVVHDTVIAHAGVLGGEPGIVVLAGTGSVALGNAYREGPFLRAGGWGYFFGDEGGALWIARMAINTAMRAQDRGEASVLTDAALLFFGAHDLRDIQHALARGELTRPALAAFALEIIAPLPDEPPRTSMEAWHIRNAAAIALADLAGTLHRRLPAVASRRISYAGGVFSNAGVCGTFRQCVEQGVRLNSGASTFHYYAGSGDDASSDDDASSEEVSNANGRRRIGFRAFENAHVVEPLGTPVDGAIALALCLAREGPIANERADS